MARRARYLITGGAGFIGSNLALALAKTGEGVRVFDDLSTGHWENLDEAGGGDIERVEADVRDAAAVLRACQGVEVVLHHAAIGSVPLSIERPVLADAVNSGGTVTLIDAARHAGVRRIVFAGSSAVYGDSPALPKREDMPPAPLSPYAVSKLSGEHHLAVCAALYGVETLSFRYFNVFGPKQRPDGAYAAAVPRFTWELLHDRPPVVYGDGTTTRDFCHVDNVVAANLAAIESPRRWAGEVVNIATGSSSSLNETVAAIGRALGRDPAPVHEAERSGDIRHSRADVTRAAELLGWSPHVDLAAGLPSTIAWLRAHARRSAP